jgi:serine/threonine protein kinase
VGGGNLLTYLKEKKRIGEEESKRIFFAIVQGVDYLHSIGVCHKDIKLENILFTENKQIKIIDFGFSMNCTPGKKQRLFCGTPSYMAPEVVRREAHEEMPTDIWSLGVILFTMVAGTFPFRAKTYPELFRKIAVGIYLIPEDIGAPCKNLITKMLEMNSSKRITANGILYHSWLSTNMLFAEDINKIRMETSILVSDPPADDINDTALEQMKIFGIPRKDVVHLILTKKRTGITTLYYLLLDYILSGNKREDSNTNSISSTSSGKFDDIKDDSNDYNKQAISDISPPIKQLNPVYEIFNITPTQQIANPYTQYYHLGNIGYINEKESKNHQNQKQKRPNSSGGVTDDQKRPVISMKKINRIFSTVITNSSEGGL